MIGAKDMVGDQIWAERIRLFFRVFPVDKPRPLGQK
jgi:hypothetical protein